MANSALLLEQEPVIVHTRPVLDMDDEQFFQFCQLNRDLQIERTAEGDIVIMPPEGGRGSSKLMRLFGTWAERDGSGQVFGSSTGFKLPNGATRSPDVAWVRNERLNALPDQAWQGFLPLSPDFVLELRSISDSMPVLIKKMEEYRDNGAQLGWLLDPASKTVHIYRPGARAERLENPSSISGEPILRGFVLKLRPIWALLERRTRN